MKAVSSDERFDDSPLSNTLTLNDSAAADGGGGGVLGGGDKVTFTGWPYDDDDDDDDVLAVRVIRLTESAIHLDWSDYQPPPSLVYYRVVWTSASNHAVCTSLTLHSLTPRLLFTIALFFVDHFVGPGRAVSLVCLSVCLCPNDNFYTK